MSPPRWTAATMRASSPAETVFAAVPTFLVAALPRPRLVRDCETLATSLRLLAPSMSPVPAPGAPGCPFCASRSQSVGLVAGSLLTLVVFEIHEDPPDCTASLGW